MNQNVIIANRGKHTLIMTRMWQTVPKRTLTGVKAEISFARFKASMDTFSGDRVLSRPFCGREFVAIVKTQGNEEKPESPNI